MQPLPPGSRRSTRLLLVAGGLLLLLGVVAFASRSGFGHSSNTAPSKAYVSYAFTIFLILFVAMIPVTVYAWIMRARRGEGATRLSPGKRFVRSILFVTVFSLLALIRHWLHLTFHVPGQRAAHTAAHHAHGKLPKQHVPADTAPSFEWTVLWIALGLFAVGMVAAVYLWRRYRIQLAPLQDFPDLSQDVADTIGDAIDDLEREPDPRRAVIAAYARMERVLGKHGLERRRSETAVEYMRRVLLGLTERGAAVERLTSLFERAKFSRHEIDAPMKAEAIGALQEIREGMA
jgi:Domain of unknown function (DUF4129)